MKLLSFACLVAIGLSVDLQSENQRLKKTNSLLLESLKELSVGNPKEAAVGFSNYKCAARNDCIYECQEDDDSKTWYACMQECPKSLCQGDAESDSIDPEGDSEESVGVTCSVAGFEGTVTTDSWCDKRDGVWMHKCSGCKYGYYWYWWHTYCCTANKGGCECAYN